MPGIPWTEKEREYLIQQVQAGRHPRDVLPELKERFGHYRTMNAVVGQLKEISYAGSTQTTKGGHSDVGTLFKQKWRETRERDTWIIEAADDRICTVDDAIKKAGVDTAIWEVEKVVVNGYDVTMKLKRNGEEKPFRSQNQQIKIVLRRKVPKPIADASAELIERMKKHSPKYPKPPAVKKSKDPHMVEIAVFDTHFGKLAWAPETGENWDIHIAENVFAWAIDNLLNRVRGFDIEYLLFPLGQDFFHIDDARKMTVHETPMEDVDGRYAKIFGAGCMACVNAIDRMAEIAPVKVLWVPGNHDRTSSWHLVAYLSAWYRRYGRVTIDLSPRARKYERYGATLLGFTHGDEEKHVSLPTIMAAEAPADWAAAKYREWHVGHWHKRKEVRFNASDTHVGVPVKVLPSLCGTDYWHYTKGYVNNQRAAEAYLWSKANGYTGHFSANADSL